jgi:hypothetical protein
MRIYEGVTTMLSLFLKLRGSTLLAVLNTVFFERVGLHWFVVERWGERA